MARSRLRTHSSSRVGEMEGARYKKLKLRDLIGGDVEDDGSKKALQPLGDKPTAWEESLRKFEDAQPDSGSIIDLGSTVLRVQSSVSREDLDEIMDSAIEPALRKVYMRYSTTVPELERKAGKERISRRVGRRALKRSSILRMKRDRPTDGSR